jgi:N-acetyl-anhydromuramyl-L-alanine amidase AmpD
MKRNLTVSMWTFVLLTAVTVAAVALVSCQTQEESAAAEEEEGEEFAARQLPEEPLPTARKHYEVKRVPTPNYNRRRKNVPIGVVLHHTALETIEETFEILTDPKKEAGTHVVIDRDGTRYVMAEPTVAVYHAGPSILRGREGCNYCTIGIEFQGNTLERPLTDDQIASAIEYLLPLTERYGIPWWNVVTHQMVRDAYREKYPEKPCNIKVDITVRQYLRFLAALKKELRI